MTWTDIDPYRAYLLSDAAGLAILQGNIDYLHKRNSAIYHHPGTGANYTTTGELGKDIDSTNFKLTLVTTGGLVMAGFCGQFLVPVSSTVRVNLIREDAISHVGRNLFYNFDVDIRANAGQGASRGWVKPFPDLPAGTHEFRAIWGISPASGTATLLVGFRPFFWVREW